jgi:hypothetical protein
MSKHLWEVNHSYYCNEGNYFSNECGKHYKSWADFLDEMGSADKDLNLLFRWDWTETTYDDEGEEKPAFNGDVNYRNGRLSMFYMQQRKGKFTYCTVEVCRADEPAVIAYLKPHLDHLTSLWAPLQATGETP